MAHSFVLRQLEFDALLAWLAPSRDQAGEKYESIRQRLLRYFEGHHCVPADECADETIDRVAKRVAAGEQIRAADPGRYFYGVAKHVFLEWQKHQVVTQDADERVARTDGAPSMRLSCLNRCLRTLPPQDRELLEAYFREPRVELAARLRVTPNALRLRVFKGKHKLRACIARCVDRHQP
jgi:DNA-directed RNA polymerase specialized sigma24 family protein